MSSNPLDIQKILTEMNFLVADSSRIIVPIPGLLLAEIQLLDYHKNHVCQQLNKHIKAFDEADYQIILAVIDDDNDRYIRLISKGIEAKSLTDKGF